MNAIFERKSIRKYTDQPISKEIIEKILSAGMAAPSAGNERPWQFLVLKDRETLTGITKLRPYSQMLKSASHAIIVCSDMRLKKFTEDFWALDCAAATEDIVPFSIISLGYPAEKKDVPDRFDETRIHWNNW